MRGASLELRLITERMRNRFSVPGRLEGTAWWPKVMDLPPGRRFLAVCPHPDDDAVGCGGTIIKLRDSGADVRVMYLSIQDGAFTRQERRDEIYAALGRLGVDDFALMEQEFPSPSDASEAIRRQLRAFNPDAVLLPSPFENHNEHLRTFEAFLPASKGWGGDVVMYEVWGALMPNLLVPVTDVMDRKAAAIAEHGTQTRDVDYVKAARGMNSYRAAASGLEGYAEAFMHMTASDVARTFG